MPAREYDRGKKKGGIRKVFDIAVFCLTLFCAVLLVFAYLARYVSPETAWIFSFAALIAPILFIANILLALYWAMRWKRVFFVPFAVLICGAGYLSLFFKPVFKQDYPEQYPSGTLTLVTHNVMGFLHEPQDGKLRWFPEGTAAFFQESKPDIICIQEFQSMDPGQKSEVDSLIGLPYNSVNYRLPTSKGGGWGVAIYSRYPIIHTGTVDFPNSSNSAIWGDIVVGKDTLRIFSNHLQTTSVDRKELEFINNHEFMDSPRHGDEIVRGITAKLRRNFAVRALQADSVSRIITDSPYVPVVCGDFNDTPMSYTYFRMRGDLNDAFVEKGRGMASNTFQGLFNIFRIDYVLPHPSIEVLSYETVETGYSDHKAVVVRLLPPSRRK